MVGIILVCMNLSVFQDHAIAWDKVIQADEFEIIEEPNEIVSALSSTLRHKNIDDEAEASLNSLHSNGAGRRHASK